jgi:uncharacterized membrane protein
LNVLKDPLDPLDDDLADDLRDPALEDALWPPADGLLSWLAFLFVMGCLAFVAAVSLLARTCAFSRVVIFFFKSAIVRSFSSSMSRIFALRS